MKRTRERTEWLRLNRHLWEKNPFGSSKVIFEKMQQAGLYSKNTNHRDARYWVEKVMEEILR